VKPCDGLRRADGCSFDHGIAGASPALFRVRSILLLGAFVATADAGPCPPAETLDHIAHATWQGPPVEPRCFAIRGKEPLVIVVDGKGVDDKPARATPGALGYAVIVDATGTVRWTDIFNAFTPGDWRTWIVVDLDGDGLDELIDYDDHHGHMGMGGRSLTVHPIVNGVPGEGSTLELDLFGFEKAALQNGCHAASRIVRDHRRSVIEVVGTRGTDPKLSPAPDRCPLVGRHRYTWDGAHLVEITIPPRTVPLDAAVK
jgi:hypothetical protein